MDEQKKREQRISANLKLDKLPLNLKKTDLNFLGQVVSDFIHHIFREKQRIQTLNWCFANIKRVKIFFD